MGPLRALVLFIVGLVLLLSGVAAAVVLGTSQPEPPSAVMSSGAARCTPASPCLAVLIDDVGRDLAALDRLLAIKADLTFSLLPHAEHTTEANKRVAAAGREQMLHLPMQPRAGDEALTDEPLVLDRQGPLSTVLAECLGRIPAAVGINNHMGSAVSGDDVWLDGLMAEVHRRKLWFVDSRTSPRSRICAAAKRRGVRCVPRDVFLDDPRDPARIEDRLEEAMGIARRRGWGVAIGHPLPETIQALEAYLTPGRELAVPVVRLSSIVASAAKSEASDGP